MVVTLEDDRCLQSKGLLLSKANIQDKVTASEKYYPIRITEPLINVSFTKEYNSEPPSFINEARFVKILDVSTSKSWVLDQNRIVLKRSDVDMLSWLVDPEENIYVLGFKGEDENDVIYVSLNTSGLLSVTRNGVHPLKLEKSMLHLDERSLRIYNSPKTGKGHIQSISNKELWVGSDSESNVIAMKTTERYAKPWNWTL